MLNQCQEQQEGLQAYLQYTWVCCVQVCSYTAVCYGIYVLPKAVQCSSTVTVQHSVESSILHFDLQSFSVVLVCLLVLFSLVRTIAQLQQSAVCTELDSVILQTQLLWCVALEVTTLGMHAACSLFPPAYDALHPACFQPSCAVPELLLELSSSKHFPAVVLRCAAATAGSPALMQCKFAVTHAPAWNHQL